MKKNYLFFSILFFQNILTAQIQSFEPLDYDYFPLTGGGGWTAVPFDFEGDGDLDVMTLRSHESDEIFLNDGTGHFSRQAGMADWQIPGGTYDFIQIDLNGDGRDDLVLGRGPASGGNGSMLDGHDQILLNMGGGTWTEASGNLPPGPDVGCIGQVFSQNKTNYTMGVESGDFNQDGIPDLVMVNSGLIYQIEIALLKPLEGQIPLCGPYFQTALKNNLYLGQPDGTVPDAPDDGVFDFLDRSSESGFGVEMSLSTDVAVADFNGDGLDDIFVANFHHEPINFVLALLGSPLLPAANVSKLWLNDLANPGEFLVSPGFPNEKSPATSVTASDFDHDGDFDLLLTLEGRAEKDVFGTKYDLGSQLFINDGNGNFTLAGNGVLPTLPPGCLRSMYDAKVVDLNGDGWEDIYLSGVESALFFQNPDDHTFTDMGHLLPRQQSDLNPYSFHTYGSAVADFSGDGRPDFFLANTYEQARVQLQMPDNQYVDLTESNLAPDGENNSAAAVADLDGDGDLDIVAAILGDCDHLQSVHEQTGDAGDHALFTDASDVFLSANFPTDHTLAANDVDGDGLPEVLFAGEGPGRFYHNLGGMEFEETGADWFPGLADFQNVSQVRFFDFDNDGDEDVFLANGRSVGLDFQPAPNALFLWNENTQKFEDSGWLPTVSRATAAADFADLNGDGWPDILAVNEDAKMEIYLSENTFPSPAPGYSIAVPAAFTDNRSGNARFADFNQDGHMDIVEVTACCPGGNPDMLPHNVYLNEGTFTGSVPDFTRHGFADDGFQTYSLAVADINSDGHPDVAAGDRNDIRFYIWDISENRLIDRTTDYTLINDISGLAMSVNDLVFSDINSDGSIDLYMARDNQDIILYGKGEPLAGEEVFWENNGLEISPNPTHGEVNILLENNVPGEITVEVFSMYGVLLEKWKTEASAKITFPVNHLGTGMFLLRLRQKNGIERLGKVVFF